MSNEKFSRACYTCTRISTTLLPELGDPRLFGTWDFKWPHGHTVVVAFQRIFGDGNDTQLGVYKQKFLSAIEPWNRSGAAIKVAFAADYLPAPPDALSARSALDSSTTIVNYDVLVSFAQLPQVLPLTERAPTKVEVVTQSSELGSYARRVDYGVPTLFVGTAKDRDPAKHLQDPWFTGTACHEFGHALGLAHTHQNPLLRRSLKGAVPTITTPASLERTLTSVFDAARPPATQDEINEEIVFPWPHVNVGEGQPVPYSDWLEVPSEPTLDQLSIMTHFGWSIITGAKGASSATMLSAPMPFDFAQLRAIYPL